MTAEKELIEFRRRKSLRSQSGKKPGGLWDVLSRPGSQRICGYLSTLHKQGQPISAALEATLRGHPLLPSF